MATYDDRLRQYEEVDEPEAFKAHIAAGIRKKFADQFDFGALSDQEVIQRHFARFGQDMQPKQYADKLKEVYGKDYVPPPTPKQTLGDRAAAAGEVAKQTAVGIAPFAVPSVVQAGAAALKAAPAAVAAVGKKVPVVGALASAGAHAVNALAEQATVGKLQATAAQVQPVDVDAKAREFAAALTPGLTAKGYTPEQIAEEARRRAENIAEGQRQTTESIDQDVARTQEEAALEPVKAATDAFFFGVGAPAIEGALQKGLARVGLIAPAAVDAAGAPVTKAAGGALARVGAHVRAGVAVGVPGMALQEGATHAVQSAAQNNSPAQIARDLVTGAKAGALHGAIGGAVLGTVAGGLEEAAGAALRPIMQRRRMREYTRALDTERAEQAKRKYESDAIMKTAESFDPRTSKLPVDQGDPAEVATSVVQAAHGTDVALSEDGLRAASAIEEKIRLYRDANAEVQKFGERALPAGPPTEQQAAPPEIGQPLGTIERAGNVAPPEEIHPLAERAPSAAPVEAPAPATPAPEPAPAPRPSEGATQFSEVAAAPFRKQVKKALESIPRAAGSLALHGPSYYTKPGVEMYMSADGKTGYALVPRPEGGKELVSAFNMGEKGLGLAAVRQAVAQGATHLDAIKPLEKLYEKAGFVTTRTEPNYVKGQPDVVYMEIPGAVAPPTPASTAIREAGPSPHVTLTEGEGGAIHLERVGVPGAADLTAAIERTTNQADAQQVPVITRIVPVPGPKGGMIPVEKLVPWYERHGFTVTESTKLPEGQMATATLRREPVPPAAKKMTMLDAQRTQMERDIASLKGSLASREQAPPSAENLAAPPQKPAPGRWHQTDLWADSNISAARERIRARQAEFPEAERDKFRQAGFAGEKPEGYRDPTSYDWADFADSVQVGVNVILKHGLNKATWIEEMVRELGGAFRRVAERVYQEAVAAYHARRPKGIDEVRRVVDDYVHQSGLGRGATRHEFYPELDPKFATRVATAYDMLDNPAKDSPAWREAEASYEALNHEVEQQYAAMTKAGYKVTHTTEDPYPTSADMRHDVAENKHIKAFKTPESADHPFMTPEQNDKFRAVHDFFGHAAEGYEFGPRGEDAAFRKHASTLSSKAIPALAVETRGQNSWVNFHVPAPKKFPPIDKELVTDAEKMLLKIRNHEYNGFDEAGFLTPSGKIVDIGGDTHANVAHNLLDEKGSLAKLLDNGFVRLHRGNNYSEINIQATRPLNDAQKSAIEKFVRSTSRARMYYDFGKFAHLAHTGYARSLEDLFKEHDAAFSPRPHQELEPKDRPFAEQKYGLLPRWTYEDALARETRAAPSRLSSDIVQRGIRGEDRAVTTAAAKLRQGVRPVKAPAAVRARFTADGGDAIREMMAVSPESATWYHDDIKKMHDLTRAEIPALKDPGHEALFDLLLGFTSPNTNVPQNYARAVTLMRDFERSGRVPFLQRFGQEVNITSRSWVKRLNALIEANGGDLAKMREYLLAPADPPAGKILVWRGGEAKEGSWFTVDRTEAAKYGDPKPYYITVKKPKTVSGAFSPSALRKEGFDAAYFESPMSKEGTYGSTKPQYVPLSEAQVEPARYNVEKEFGEKVGPFTLNIQGIHDQITVDVWMVRRLRRIAGTLYREGKLNEDWTPTASERRDIEASIGELSKQTGLDHDAVQAVLWDNEKMIWERAGLASPRIPFSVAAERVLKNLRERHGQIEESLRGPDQQSLLEKP